MAPKELKEENEKGTTTKMSFNDQSVEAWDDSRSADALSQGEGVYMEEVFVAQRIGDAERNEEPAETKEKKSVVSADEDIESGEKKYPLPVGDVTCCFRKGLIKSPLDVFTLTFGWLLLNKTQILSGITVALAQVPEAVSFSFVAGVDPIVGLQSAWIMGICTSLGGGRPGMVAGATGAVAVVLTGLIKEHGMGHLFYAIMFAGIIQMVFGFLKLGVIVRMIPHPGKQPIGHNII